MTITEKVDNLPPVIIENDIEYRMLISRGNEKNHILSWVISYVCNNETYVRFENVGFEEVVIVAYEWFRKNKPEMVDGKRRY